MALSIDSTKLFQLIFTFIYYTINNNFSISSKYTKFKHSPNVQILVGNPLTNKEKNKTQSPQKRKREKKMQGNHNITRGNKTEVTRNTPLKEVIIIISFTSITFLPIFCLCSRIVSTHTLSLLSGDEDNLVVIIEVVVAPTLKHFCSVLLSITSWEFSKFCKLLSY